MSYKKKYFTEKYWRGLLRGMGYDAHTTALRHIVYRKGKIFVQIIFTKMASLTSAETSTRLIVYFSVKEDNEPYSYICLEGPMLVVKHFDSDEDHEKLSELRKVLKAVIDPGNAPMCIGIEWAEKLIAYVLSGEIIKI